MERCIRGTGGLQDEGVVRRPLLEVGGKELSMARRESAAMTSSSPQMRSLGRKQLPRVHNVVAPQKLTEAS